MDSAALELVLNWSLAIAIAATIMSTIQIKNLAKHYGPIRALHQVSFEVQSGEIIGLLGPNGAGKTTLMKILTGFLQPDEGEALIGGLDVVQNPLLVQRQIGYLPEQAPLYGEMVVQEYLGLMASLRGIPEEDHRRVLSRAIYATGLEDYLLRPIGQLSKGYRQRVGIAQAILHEPALLILDEPTSGLDPTQIVEIRGLVRRLAERSTVVLSTHILSEVEMTCDRVVIIIRGEVRADAQLAELRATNAAVVAVEDKALGAKDTLQNLTPVKTVEALDTTGAWRRYRVTGEGDLCPAIYDAMAAKNWRLRELRRDERTLEAFFRELTEQPDAVVQGGEL